MYKMLYFLPIKITFVEYDFKMQRFIISLTEIYNSIKRNLWGGGLKKNIAFPKKRA